MAKLLSQAYQEQFQDAKILFNPFTIRSMGISQSQTSLKVGAHLLSCGLYQLTMTQVILLGVMNQEELIFFQGFKNGIGGLSLVAQTKSSLSTTKIFCRCQISNVMLMKERENVGLIVCNFKPLPPALAELMGEYLINLEHLKSDWIHFHDRVIQMNQETVRKLRYNNYATMKDNGVQQKIALYSISVNRLDFLVQNLQGELIPEKLVSFTLFFQRYRMSISGKIESNQNISESVYRIKAKLDFSPELTELLVEYFTGNTGKD